MFNIPEQTKLKLNTKPPGFLTETPYTSDEKYQFAMLGSCILLCTLILGSYVLDSVKLKKFTPHVALYYTEF